MRRVETRDNKDNRAHPLYTGQINRLDQTTASHEMFCHR